MAYASASHVAILCKNLVGPEQAFTSETSPTDGAVDSWLDTGESVINVRLANRGYGPIGVSSTAYGLAQQCNALYGAWMAERSRINARTGPGAANRADQLKEDFESLMEVLLEMDLSSLGVARLDTSNAKPYAGGISESDKSDVEADTDRVEPRFKRDMNRNPERPV